VPALSLSPTRTFSPSTPRWRVKTCEEFVAGFDRTSEACVRTNPTSCSGVVARPKRFERPIPNSSFAGWHRAQPSSHDASRRPQHRRHAVAGRGRPAWHTVTQATCVRICRGQPFAWPRRQFHREDWRTYERGPKSAVGCFPRARAVLRASRLTWGYVTLRSVEVGDGAVMFALVVAKPRLLLGSDQHLTGLPGGLDYRSTAFEPLLGRHPSLAKHRRFNCRNDDIC
jgi:hypothetical protein